jgi:predicted dehydrogenase
VTPVRVAVIGAGNIGRRHLRTIREITAAAPVAVSRRLTVRQELAAEGYGTAASIRDAVNEGVTLCVVATETAQHTEDACAALEAGCDVLVEKPLGVDVADALSTGRAALKSNRSIHVGCVLRFSDSLSEFRRLLPRIGSAHSVRVACQAYLPDWRTGRPLSDYYSSREDGGVLRDLIHEVDYTGWIFGWPVAIQARLRNLGRLGIVAEETAELLWEIPEGPTVNMSLDFLTRPPRRSMVALGENGTLEWDGIRGTTTLSMFKEAPETHSVPETIDQLLRLQDGAFIDFRNRSDPRLATDADALKALAICDTARRASQNGHVERVQYP